jgi:hypothetical protein
MAAMYMSKLDFCEHCIFDKHNMIKLNASVYTTKEILDYVHADVCIPYCETFLSGTNYVLIIFGHYFK